VTRLVMQGPEGPGHPNKGSIPLDAFELHTSIPLRGDPDLLDDPRLIFAVFVYLGDDGARHILSQDFFLFVAEKTFRIFIEKSDAPHGISSQDDAGRVLHQFSVFPLAFLKPLKGQRVAHAEADLRCDSHHEIDFALGDSARGGTISNREDA
jgi:hypothetical protein